MRGYHAYKDSWTTVVGQHLETRPEDDNPVTVDHFAVAVLIQDNIVGHLPKGKHGPYAKTISYFLKTRSRGRNSCTVIVTGECSLGDKMGSRYNIIPCQLFMSLVQCRRRPHLGYCASYTNIIIITVIKFELYFTAKSLELEIVCINRSDSV